MARTAVGRDGVHWRVGRRWLPFRVRLRRDDPGDLGLGNVGDLAPLDSPGGVLAGLALIALVILLFVVIWPIVAIAIELVIVAFVLVGAVAGRVIFRRPWTVVARSETRNAQEHSWRVVGWRNSGQLIDEVAESLEHGRALPPGATSRTPDPSPGGPTDAP